MTEPGSVLVVDDVPADAAAMARVLRGDGHDIREAHSGAEALAAIEKSPPDVLVIDFFMPEMTGCDVVRALEVRGRVPPVIVVSGYSIAVARAECPTHPELVVAWVEKGDAGRLRAAVWMAIRLHRAHASVAAARADLHKELWEVEQTGDVARAVRELAERGRHP